jgi:hypothetical protein
VVGWYAQGCYIRISAKEITMHNLFFIRRRFPNHHVTIIAVIGALSCLALGLGVMLLLLMPAG